MYANLYRGLGLKSKELSRYETPLVGFYRKTMTPKRMIKFSVQTSNEVVEVGFIVVDPYSFYTVIFARTWLHTIGSHLIYLACESEVPKRRARLEAIRVSNHGQAMYGYCYHTPITASESP